MRPLKNIAHYLIIISLLVINTSFAQFRFVHISDVHISDGDSYVNNSDIGGQVFSQMITTIRNLDPKPAFVVVSGDVSNIGNGLNDGMYAVLTQYLFPNPLTNPGNGEYFADSSLTIPLYFVPGNHEYYMLLTPPLSNAAIPNYTAQLAPDSDYVIHYQNAAIMMMRSGSESFRPIWVDTNPTTSEGSGIENSQMSWLQNALALNTAKKKIIVMHHPLVNAVGTSADGTPSTSTVLDPADGSILNNRDALLNLCEAGADITLSGHIHQNVVASGNGSVVDENWTGGTRYIQTGACEYGNYRIITVDSNFVWVGTPQQLEASGLPDNKGYATDLSFTAFFEPSQRTVIINLDNKTFDGDPVISIFSVNGSELMRTAVKLSNSNTLTLDVNDLAAGLYILRMSGNNGTGTRKIAIY